MVSIWRWRSSFRSLSVVVRVDFIQGFPCGVGVNVSATVGSMSIDIRRDYAVGQAESGQDSMFWSMVLLKFLVSRGGI